MILICFLLGLELGGKSESFLLDIATLSLYDPNAVTCDELLLNQATIYSTLYFYTVGIVPTVRYIPYLPVDL